MFSFTWLLCNMSSTIEKCSVVIVGAGASALYCAHLLAKNGVTKDVVLLEARDRIGGRIHSVEEQFTTIQGETRNVVVDHGAAWVHGTGYEWGAYKDGDNMPEPIPESNPMMELLTEAKGISDLYKYHLNPVCKKGNPWIRPKHVLHDENEIVLYLAGKQLDKDDPIIGKALSRHFEILEMVSDYGNDMFDEGRAMETFHHSLQDVIDQIKGSLTVLDRHESDRIEALAKLYQYMMEAWYAGQASDMQLFEFTRDEDEEMADDGVFCEEGDFYGPHCTLREGMKTVLEPLLTDECIEHVRCGQEVTGIKQTETNTVMVETKTGVVVEADCCVVTIPVGCLKEAVEEQTLFHPALSTEKVEAINCMRMGKYKKVLLTFDSIFWSTQEVMIGMVRKTNPDERCSKLGNVLLFDNLWARDQIPCIEAILTGDAATWATGKDTETVCNAVLDFMKDAMGLDDDPRDWCTDSCHVTRWEEDRFSKGAYSCYTLGTRKRHTKVLRRSEWGGKLVFAGEACVSEHEGSVHAALFSARNAAEEVRKLLDSRSTS